ncbi:hypothetical protein GQX73_g7226 [Xylaria multiplex]|uniref:Uncharacterized protein n=1 Tax=Xylaria multiplex TaxID=323545 RepID=A0A7C8IL41_9PEZI|nr:hypothetical protein GQX73_g7226 [Xylaria multiplex]
MQSTNEMSTYFPHQDLGQVPSGSFHGLTRDCTCQCPPADTTTAFKRQLAEDDDDIQFISEKPVKRRRISEKKSTITKLQQPMTPFAATPNTESTAALNPSTVATEMSENDLKNMERRLSTGMVGLQPDIHAVELTYALRGVSMPVLENFVLDQPFRKPRPLSPPELSPKQLPSTISSAMLSVQSDQHVPGAFGFKKTPNSQSPCGTCSHTCCQAEKLAMTQDLTKIAIDTHQDHALETPVKFGGHTTQISSTHGKSVALDSTLMPPPPLTTLTPPEPSHHTPCVESSPRLTENYYHHNVLAHSQKQPCQVCSRMRHQAQLARVQGLPIVNTALPPHFISQHYHPSYGQHLSPQVMTAPTSNMHGFRPDFVPVMIPNNGGSFVPLTPGLQQASPHQNLETEQQKRPPSEQSSKPKSPQTSHLKNTTTSPSVTSSPIKPPPSLIQPTYRKPSPNLIVDVAETCQQKFPFEEVAKRHNVPVDKVFEVFAAIIQVSRRSHSFPSSHISGALAT